MNNIVTFKSGFTPRSFKLVPFESVGAVSRSPSIVTMAVPLTVYEIFRDLENWLSGCSRSLKTAPFDRPLPNLAIWLLYVNKPEPEPHTTFYWPAIVNIALSCIVFELFDVEYRNLQIWVRGHSRSFKLVPFESLEAVSYSSTIVTMAVSLTVYKIFSFKV